MRPTRYEAKPILANGQIRWRVIRQLPNGFYVHVGTPADHKTAADIAADDAARRGLRCVYYAPVWTP